MTVIIASTNPAKIEAVKRAFVRMFPNETFLFEGISVASGVSGQPMSEADTKQGAINRAANARQAHANADFWVGLEGGVQDDLEGLLSFGWVCVLGRERRGLGRSASFYLPEAVARLVRAGTELGAADDQIFGRSGSNKEEGAVGLMTHKAIDRTTAFEHAVILALIPFKNIERY